MSDVPQTPDPIPQSGASREGRQRSVTQQRVRLVRTDRQDGLGLSHAALIAAALITFASVPLDRGLDQDGFARYALLSTGFISFLAAFPFIVVFMRVMWRSSSSRVSEDAELPEVPRKRSILIRTMALITGALTAGLILGGLGFEEPPIVTAYEFLGCPLSSCPAATTSPDATPPLAIAPTPTVAEPTATETATLESTASATSTPTSEPTETHTPEPTATGALSPTLEPTREPTATATATISVTATSTDEDDQAQYLDSGHTTTNDDTQWIRTVPHDATLIISGSTVQVDGPGEKYDWTGSYINGVVVALPGGTTYMFTIHIGSWAVVPAEDARQEACKHLRYRSYQAQLYVPDEWGWSYDSCSDETATNFLGPSFCDSKSISSFTLNGESIGGNPAAWEPQLETLRDGSSRLEALNYDVRDEEPPPSVTIRIPGGMTADAVVLRDGVQRSFFIVGGEEAVICGDDFTILSMNLYTHPLSYLPAYAGTWIELNATGAPISDRYPVGIDPVLSELLEITASPPPSPPVPQQPTAAAAPTATEVQTASNDCRMIGNYQL